MADFLNKNLLRLVLVFLFAASAGAQGVATARAAGEFQNPVLDADFPDPTVIRAKDGYYYAYATQTIVDGKLHHIQAARSKDMVNWERLPDALPEKPVWADKTDPKFWAPHVSEADGKYFMYYSADPNTQKGLCLAVATSDSPRGPFKDIGKPLQCGESFVNIDPMAFDDPKTGKQLLYWGSGFQPIKVQELAPNRTEFLQGSKPVDLVATIKNEDPSNYQRLIEGAWVVYRKGYYYLFYSGDNCCGDEAHYAVMVARSKNATGPFETLANATGRKNSVILELNDMWIAPGHNSVITDAKGQDWMVYHAINSKNRNLAKAESIGGDRGDRRVMLMSRIVYRNGWPTVETRSPSAGKQKTPAARK
jgi:arabinan endo-1,5-alpha-L-arabinosidase